MLKAEVLEFNGIIPAIHGMRNPMNSWDKSDSKYCCEMKCEDCPLNEDGVDCAKPYDPIVGKNDLDLMLRLCKAGTEHRKYLRMINVYVDITAPLYWWKEFDTYKIGTVCNSCSTMHKIHAKQFTLDDFSTNHLIPESLSVLKCTLRVMNEMRDLYLGFDGFRHKYNVADKKEIWWQMIQLLPSSYNQKRTIMLNYETILSIIRQRKNHKLDEWHQLIEVLMDLPLVKDLAEVTTC